MCIECLFPRVDVGFPSDSRFLPDRFASASGRCSRRGGNLLSLAPSCVLGAKVFGLPRFAAEL